MRRSTSPKVSVRPSNTNAGSRGALAARTRKIVEMPARPCERSLAPTKAPAGRRLVAEPESTSTFPITRAQPVTSFAASITMPNGLRGSDFFEPMTARFSGAVGRTWAMRVFASSA